MQVTAFCTPAHPEWRWRICDYAGEVAEESDTNFPTIAAAVAQGTARLAQMNRERVRDVDRSTPARGYRATARPPAVMTPAPPEPP
jgi:hypothetical protein